MRFGQTIERRRWVAMLLAFLLAAVTLVAVAAPARATTPAEDALNDRFITWYDEADVYHLYSSVIGVDVPEANPVFVDHGDTVLFGFEFGADFQPPITLSIDGGAANDVSSGYQSAFTAMPGVGPARTWDHDNDGIGDGNSNGIVDWSGTVTFYRFESAPITETTTFRFVTSGNDETVTVVPGLECEEETCEIEAPDGENWEGEITCEGDCTVEVNDAEDGEVAQIIVDSTDPYKIVVTTTDKGPNPGQAEVEVDADDDSKDGVMEKCEDGDTTNCVQINRVGNKQEGPHTQYCVFFDGEPNFKFR